MEVGFGFQFDNFFLSGSGWVSIWRNFSVVIGLSFILTSSINFGFRKFRVQKCRLVRNMQTTNDDHIRALPYIALPFVDT